MSAPVDSELEAFLEPAARAVVDDIVARIIANDVEKDRLIGDLVATVNWLRSATDESGHTGISNQQVIGHGLRYAREHRQ